MSSTEIRDDGSILDAATALAGQGRAREAIALLSETNRRHRSVDLELALLEIRHSQFHDDIDPPSVAADRSSPPELEFVDGVASVTAEELSAAALHTGIERSGCLMVPALLAPPQVERLVEGIDHTFAAFDAWQADPEAPRDDEARSWLTPFTPDEQYGALALGGRAYTRMTGGIWTVDSPRMLFEVIELFESLGLGSIIASHLGEWPALSAAKCNLRRTPVDRGGGWHQDGSFLGHDISTLDVWIALSDCGNDAPGIDIVPHRFDHFLQAGLDTVVIPHETVLAECDAVGVPVVSRQYQAGDALFFDHRFVHRTADEPGLTRERYALETWFFGPSCYPEKQVPLLY